MFSCLLNKFYNMIKFGKMALDMFITKMYFFILDRIFLSIRSIFPNKFVQQKMFLPQPIVNFKDNKNICNDSNNDNSNDIGCVHKSHTNLNSNTYSIIKAMIMIT